MGADRVTDAVASGLGALLWALGLVVVAGSAAIIVTMDGSSASQGGRYYVAIAAIVALVFIDRQMAMLMRRRLPWRFGTQPAERRYHARSFLLLLLISLFLLGLAHYQTTGSPAGLERLIGYGLALGVGLFLIAFVVSRFVREPVERGTDYSWNVHQDAPGRPSTSRTFSFSFGTPPMRTGHAMGTIPRSSVSAYHVAQYLEAWRQLQTSFETDPEDAVRRAHQLLLELCTTRSHPGVFARQEHFTASTLSGVGSLLDGARGRLKESRSMQVAVQAALAGEPAKREDLARAMMEYERTLKELLDDQATT